MLFKKLLHCIHKTKGSAQANEVEKIFATFKANALLDGLHDRQNNADRISAVLNWASERGYLEQLGIDSKHTDKLRSSFLQPNDDFQEMLGNPNLRNELGRVVAQRSANNSPVKPAEAMQGVDLLVTGELFQDVVYSISGIFTLIAKPDRFTNQDENLRAFVAGLASLPDAIASDLNPESAKQNLFSQIKQLQSGQTLQESNLFSNTLTKAYALPEVGDVIDTANSLLDEENESLRLALLIYARLNGVNLEQKDIDKTRETVFNRETPNLGALLVYIADQENLARIVG